MDPVKGEAGRKAVSTTIVKIKQSRLDEAKYHIGYLSEELEGTRRRMREVTSPGMIKTYRENIKEIQDSITKWEEFAKQASKM